MSYNRTTWVDDSLPAINATNLNNIEVGIQNADVRTTYGTTVGGTANAITLTTTDGDFTFTVGESIKFIATATNTGASTVNVDGDGSTTIKKLDGTSYVALEGDEIVDNAPIELICLNDGMDFFLLAPKGGSNIKSVQSGEFNWSGTGTSSNVTISEIKSENSIVIIEQYMVNENASIGAIGARITSDTNLNFTRRVGGSWNGSSKLKWQVIEFNNVKSKQTGIKSIGTTATEETVTISSINTDKCLLITSQTSDTIGNAITYYESASNVLNSTTLSFYGHFESYVYWQVIEFN